MWRTVFGFAKRQKSCSRLVESLWGDLHAWVLCETWCLALHKTHELCRHLTSVLAILSLSVGQNFDFFSLQCVRTKLGKLGFSFWVNNPVDIRRCLLHKNRWLKGRLAAFSVSTEAFTGSHKQPYQKTRLGQVQAKSLWPGVKPIPVHCQCPDSLSRRSPLTGGCICLVSAESL